MPASTEPAPLLRRTAERQALADAIERHGEALTQVERVAEAQQRTDNVLYGKLLPAVERSREALAAARAHEPRRLVDAALGEPGARSTVADAEHELADAERKVDESRRTRTLLAEEAKRANDTAEATRHALANAVRAVVRADPARAALVDAYVASARRTLRLGQALKSAGVDAGSVDAHGQRLVLESIPVAIGARSAFSPDPEWETAIAALSEDPDLAFPGLPEPESEDADAGNAPAEAA